MEQDYSKLPKHERIALKKKQGLIKDRHSRKLEKFSDNFNEIFNFFLNGFRMGLFDTPGEYFRVDYDKDAESGKMAFRRYEDGKFANTSNKHFNFVIKSRQPNITYAVICAKKSMGLNMSMWIDGIAECNFTAQEIIDDFERIGLKMPVGFQTDLRNRSHAMKIDLALKQLKK